MALDRQNLLTLMKKVASADPSAKVSYSFEGQDLTYAGLNEALRTELQELAGSYSLYRENKNYIFSLMEETLDDILPKKVVEQYNQFAEVKTFAQGDSVKFKRPIGSNKRAKQFITRVGLAGIYEVFKLAKNEETFEVRTSAIGGAAQIGFEEFLDGRVDFVDVLDIVMEGLDECVYLEIERALKGAVSSLQSANKYSGAGFSEAEMDRLIQVADAYGNATIYCTYEFAATMIPDQNWVSDAMKDQKWNNGYLGNYKGHRVIVLNQSFEDDTNSTKVIDPAYAWIIPTGGNDKPVKVAFEGQTIVNEYVNKDLSREIQVYKKLGVGAIITNNICVYVNTSLKQS